jgi:hypothetical protein
MKHRRINTKIAKAVVRRCVYLCVCGFKLEGLINIDQSLKVFHQSVLRKFYGRLHQGFELCGDVVAGIGLTHGLRIRIRTETESRVKRLR